MINIGICDDCIVDREKVKFASEQYLKECGLEYTIIQFEKGEEILEYCGDVNNPRIDLLFLDIEMPGLDGIDVKNRILKQNQVWRIVFVSSHQERVFDSFGLKTMGFVIKPASNPNITKWIRLVHDELKEEEYIELYTTEKTLGKIVRLEDIEYVKADRNYTVVFMYPMKDTEQNSILVSKKIGVLEKEWKKYPFIRVHKSYLVNLMNVSEVMHLKKKIVMRDLDERIPIGRTYQDEVIKRYREFGREKARKRL